LANEKGYESLVVPPGAFLAMMRRNGGAVDVGAEAMPTLAASGVHHALTIPPFLSALRSARPRNSGIDQPTPTVLAQGGNMALVIPYRRANQPTTTDEPLHAVASRDSAALVAPAVAVEDCLFRMLQPREHLRAQAFPDTYIVHGNKGEQTMQAGNAVSANVAQWLGEQVYAALGGAA
jgi:DNA (cytosine-5)-methyltransferase 1